MEHEQKQEQNQEQNQVSPLPLFFLTALFLMAILHAPQMLGHIKTAWTGEEPLQAALAAVETKSTESLLGKQNFLDLNGAFSKLIQKKEINDTLILSDGSLTTTFMDINVDPYVQSLGEFHRHLQDQDIPFAYVQAPGKLPSDSHSLLPTGFLTYGNQNADRLLAGLEGEGIPSLDLRESIQTLGLDHQSLFPATDPHWSIQGAFALYPEVARLLDTLLGEQISNSDFFDLAQFQIETYPNIWLGPFGQRTGIYVAGIDDFSIITPDFPTHFTFEIPSADLHRSGSFREACLNFDYSPLDVIQDKYGLYNYHTEYVKITNHQADNQYKILLNRDSFAGPIALFLSLHVREVHLYDTRHGCEADDMYQLIQEIQPHAVLQFQTIGLEDDRHFLLLNPDS